MTSTSPTETGVGYTEHSVACVAYCVCGLDQRIRAERKEFERRLWLWVEEVRRRIASFDGMKSGE